MTGKTHRVVGLASATTYLVYSAPVVGYSPATFATILVGAYFASLIPDLDRSTADFWSNLPMGKTVGKIVDPLIKHRNISHSILGVLLFSLFVYSTLNSFPNYWGIEIRISFIAIVIAYCSHLLADMFTVDGIPLFYPIKRPLGIPPKPFHGARILTGEWFENLIIFPLVDIYFVAIIIVNWQIISKIIYK